MNDIIWMNPGHKQRRYTLRVSKDWRFFKKSTTSLHKTLGIELECLTKVKEASLTKIQRLVSGDINPRGESYIITEYCGRNITRNKVPEDWASQLDTIDSELNLLIDQYKIYHNDVQVRNLFVDTEGQLTLIDFDLASIGSPNRKAKKRPWLLNCDAIRSKFKKWRIK